MYKAWGRLPKFLCASQKVRTCWLALISSSSSFIWRSLVGTLVGINWFDFFKSSIVFKLELNLFSRPPTQCLWVMNERQNKLEKILFLSQKYFLNCSQIDNFSQKYLGKINVSNTNFKAFMTEVATSIRYFNYYSDLWQKH